MVKVLHPGFFSTIQDLGRKKYQHLGVPLSGPMDEHAAKIANAVLGNDDHCAVMEITMLGPKLEFNCNTIIAITGANLSPCLNGNNIKNNLAINITKGDVLFFGKPINGFRAYIAVSEGFQSEIVLHSRSMYQGVTQNYRLQKGDVLDIKPKNYSSRKYAVLKFNVSYLEKQIIEVYRGPEFELLNDAQIDVIFNQTFTISKENNRMAYQLNELITNDLNDIITSLVLPGTIQLTPSGKLIVLMRDCQTTGGYPRILQLSKTSTNTFAQKMTGSKISFMLVDYPL